MSADILYFGCLGRRSSGHQLVGPGLRSVHEDAQPWKGHSYNRPHIDGGITRSADTAQGHAVLHHEYGWTALAIHDYTGDSRGNSHSTFVIEGTFDADEMIAMATETYPTLIARIGPIVVDGR